MRTTALMCGVAALALLAPRASAEDANNSFNNQKDFDYAQELLKMTPQGPEGKFFFNYMGCN